MKKVILSAEKINKVFQSGTINNVVLSDIDLEIYEGDFTIIMGSSGAGKSTLLYSLSGMDPITSGKIIYKEKDITTLNDKEMAKLRSEEFGFVFQQSNLVSNLTLYENVLVAGLLDSRQDKDEAYAMADKLLTEMNIGDERHRMPAFVSGGEALRTAIARGMIGNPGILFADEPTGALNKRNTDGVLDIFTRINERGQSILMVTHDIHAAIRGNRVLYLEDGRIKGEFLFHENMAPGSIHREEELSSWLTKMHW